MPNYQNYQNDQRGSYYVHESRRGRGYYNNNSSRGRGSQSYNNNQRNQREYSSNYNQQPYQQQTYHPDHSPHWASKSTQNLPKTHDQQQRSFCPNLNPKCNICIRFIPNHWYRTDILEHFGEFGLITSCMKAHNKSLAFVAYASPDSARRAIEAMDRKEFRKNEAGGMTVRVGVDLRKISIFY